MGNWSITIQGIGSHHNQASPHDANRLARQLVEVLTAAGHTIERADFTHGRKEDLLDPNQAHPDDRPRSNAQVDPLAGSVTSGAASIVASQERRTFTV